MAVVKDAASGSKTGAPATSLSWSHTCTGSDLLLLVAFSNSNGGLGGGTVTYNGVAMTPDPAGPFNGASSNMYYLIAPATGAHTVSISSLPSGDIQAVAFSCTGAQQTGTPYSIVEANAGSGTHSGSITTTADGLGVAFESSGNSISTPNKTDGSIQNNNAGSAVGNYACQSSPGTGGSINFTWADNGDQWYMILANVLASTGGAVAPGRATRLVEFVKQVGTVTNTSSATTSAITVATGGVPVGNSVVILASHDNSNTAVAGAIQVTSVADTRLNTWTVLPHAIADPGAANAGQEGWIAYSNIVVALQASDTITITYAITVPAKAIRADEFKYMGKLITSTTQDNQTGTSSSVAVEATGIGQLVIGAVCAESGTADSFTQDADTTNGAWVNPGRIGSGTTTSGATLNPIYKIVTAPGTQTYNPTMGTSRDHCAVLALFECLPYDARRDAVFGRHRLRSGRRRR